MSGSAVIPPSQHMLRELPEVNVRLRGAAVWAAYGAVEALFAIMIRRVLFAGAFVPPDDRYTLVLLVLYPLAGALLGRFAILGLAIAFAANSLAVMHGSSLWVVLTSVAIVLVLFRRSPWMASLLLLLPMWAAREIGFFSTFRTKALLAGGAVAAVLLLAFFCRRVRWSPRPAQTVAIFVLTMLAAMFVDARPPRDLAPSQPPPRVSSPNIVLIVMDTVRADHLSAYGYARNTTPRLAQFAKTATLYTRAYAPANMTLPSHASLFTGLYGSEHTAHVDEGWDLGRPLPARAITAAEILAARGYATACIAANGYLAEGFGLDQGFQHLDVRPPWIPFGITSDFYLRFRVAAIASHVIELPRRTRHMARGGDEISDSALAFLDRMEGKRRPFFLVLNYLDAHHPYVAPEPYDTMFPGYDPAQPVDLDERLIAAFNKGIPRITRRQQAHLISQYDGSIAYLDRQIARVLGALRERGVYERTLIIVLSDHGESFGEHQVLTHGFSNYESETRVPLIVKHPGQTAGEVVAVPVSLLSVWPLLSSMPRPASAIMTESFPMRGAAATFPSRRAGTAKIEGMVKTILNVNGSVESYDLAADPGETRNLAPSTDSQRMASEIAAWRRSLRSIDSAPPSRAIDPEVLRRLRALGYVR